MEENTGEKLYDIGFSNDFSDTMPEAQATKRKADKLNYMKMQNFCTWRTQPVGLETISANRDHSKEELIDYIKKNRNLTRTKCPI